MAYESIEIMVKELRTAYLALVHTAGNAGGPLMLNVCEASLQTGGDFLI